jgi:hypothetical protein
MKRFLPLSRKFGVLHADAGASMTVAVLVAMFFLQGVLCWDWLVMDPGPGRR